VFNREDRVMDIKVNSRNMKLTDGLEDYARRKVERLDRYLPNIRQIRVDLARQHNSRGEDMSIAQITVQHERGAILRAEEKDTGEIHHIIDTAVDKMYRRIKRFKGKRTDSKRRNRERYFATPEELEVAEALPIPDVPDAPVDDTADDDAVEVTRRKTVELIPMAEGEAIDQMELLGHSFFMFFNAETGKVNVLYRRDENGYGLMEPTD
jgi:putative sigma-54 modulation protein